MSLQETSGKREITSLLSPYRAIRKNPGSGGVNSCIAPTPSRRALK
jgi:hypothetical protein